MQQKDKFNSMFHGVFDIVSIIDPEYNILMVNRAYEKLLGKFAAECIDRKCYAVMRNRDTPCQDCPILQTRLRHEDTDNLLVSIGDDTVSLTRHPIYNDKGEIKGILEIGRVVTRELKMEEELRHHGRLKILGELSSSIVHEIKNPLAGIGLMTISIMERLKEKNSIHKDLGNVLQEIQRLEKLLENLMNFAKPSAFKLTDTDIHTIIDSTLRLLNKKFKVGKINVKEIFASNIPQIPIDSAKMKQVFFNILLNSIEAMPTGGEITITTTILPEEDAQHNEKKQLQILIHDTGIGIKEEYLSSIFDPFFSKSLHGVGLGLSIAYKIIELHHGCITAQSHEGAGTSIKICIPLEVTD
ncbi:MAG: two-component system sensor histidine kinase NtrB [bacterium]